MNFYEALEKTSYALSQVGTTINADDYDGLIVKRLEASNTLDAERSSNQTHIAITGEQMDIFPYVRSDGYFKFNDNDLKKYYITQISIFLCKSNVLYLTKGDASYITFDTDFKKTRTSVVRSSREYQNEQVQISLLNYDGKDFISFRRLLHVGSYLIILKRKSKLEFEAYGISNIDNDVSNSILELNNHFYKLPTNTAIDADCISINASNITLNDGIKAKGGINKIYYGAPGCGKSHFITKLLDEAEVDNDNRIRVTFHPEYSNCDFIGQILPTIEKKDTGEDIVKYIFNPGPFTLALQKAYSTNEMVYLIIEEINRGNAAAIFGDMFQLLDRVNITSNRDYSSSEYPVYNPNMQRYLIDNVNDYEIKVTLKNGVYLPGNLTILATMNSSDQNVFTLDTAFKRRWTFKQISNDIVNDKEHKYKYWYIPGTNVTWETFLTALNNEILRNKIYNQTNEDKRLGKYFVSEDCLTKDVKNISEANDSALNFAYKVLEYVWNDVCKIGREEWFDTEKNKTLEDLINSFLNPQNGETPLSIFQNINF